MEICKVVFRSITINIPRTEEEKCVDHLMHDCEASVRPRTVALGQVRHLDLGGAHHVHLTFDGDVDSANFDSSIENAIIALGDHARRHPSRCFEFVHPHESVYRRIYHVLMSKCADIIDSAGLNPLPDCHAPARASIATVVASGGDSAIMAESADGWTNIGSFCVDDDALQVGSAGFLSLAHGTVGPQVRVGDIVVPSYSVEGDIVHSNGAFSGVRCSRTKLEELKKAVLASKRYNVVRCDGKSFQFEAFGTEQLQGGFIYDDIIDPQDTVGYYFTNPLDVPSNMYEQVVPGDGLCGYHAINAGLISVRLIPASSTLDFIARTVMLARSNASFRTSTLTKMERVLSGSRDTSIYLAQEDAVALTRLYDVSIYFKHGRMTEVARASIGSPFIGLSLSNNHWSPLFRLPTVLAWNAGTPVFPGSCALSIIVSSSPSNRATVIRDYRGGASLSISVPDRLESAGYVKSVLCSLGPTASTVTLDRNDHSLLTLHQIKRFLSFPYTTTISQYIRQPAMSIGFFRNERSHVRRVVVTEYGSPSVDDVIAWCVADTDLVDTRGAGGAGDTHYHRITTSKGATDDSYVYVSIHRFASPPAAKDVIKAINSHDSAKTMGRHVIVFDGQPPSALQSAVLAGVGASFSVTWLQSDVPAPVPEGVTVDDDQPPQGRVSGDVYRALVNNSLSTTVQEISSMASSLPRLPAPVIGQTITMTRDEIQRRLRLAMNGHDCSLPGAVGMDFRAVTALKAEAFVNYLQSTLVGRETVSFTLHNTSSVNAIKSDTIKVTQHTGDMLDSDQLIVDFANRRIGGGVLGRGLVQEEVLFLCCPEAVIARALFGPMRANQCVLIEGVMQTSNFDSSTKTFSLRKSPRSRAFVAIDAVPNGSIRRGGLTHSVALATDSAKFAMACHLANSLGMRLASGLWGCGAFGRNVNAMVKLQLNTAFNCATALDFWMLKNEPLAQTVGLIIGAWTKKMRRRAGPAKVLTADSVDEEETTSAVSLDSEDKAEAAAELVDNVAKVQAQLKGAPGDEVDQVEYVRNADGKIFHLMKSAGMDPNGILRDAMEHLVRNDSDFQNKFIATMASQGYTISEKDRKPRVVIKTQIDPVISHGMERAFPEFELVFTNATRSDHPSATVSRKLALALFDKFLSPGGEHRSTSKTHDVLVCNIGGNAIGMFSLNLWSSHTCAPVLDFKDTIRANERQVNMTRVPQFRSFCNDNIATTGRFSRLCTDKGQDCNVTAEECWFVHSTYDMTTLDIADIMQKKRALKGMGCVHASPEVIASCRGEIDATTGVILDAGLHWSVDRSEGRVTFDFRDGQTAYVHEIDTYLSFLSDVITSSDGRCMYAIQLTTYRMGVQMFSIHPMETCPKVDVVKTMPAQNNVFPLSKCTMYVPAEDKLNASFFSAMTDSTAAATFVKKTVLIPTDFLDAVIMYCNRMRAKNYSLTNAQAYGSSVNMNGTSSNKTMAFNLSPHDLDFAVVFAYVRTYHLRFWNTQTSAVLTSLFSAARSYRVQSVLQRLGGMVPIVGKYIGTPPPEHQTPLLAFIATMIGDCDAVERYVPQVEHFLVQTETHHDAEPDYSLKVRAARIIVDPTEITVAPGDGGRSAPSPPPSVTSAEVLSEAGSDGDTRNVQFDEELVSGLSQVGGALECDTSPASFIEFRRAPPGGDTDYTLRGPDFNGDEMPCVTEDDYTNCQFPDGHTPKLFVLTSDAVAVELFCSRKDCVLWNKLVKTSRGMACVIVRREGGTPNSITRQDLYYTLYREYLEDDDEPRVFFHARVPRQDFDSDDSEPEREEVENSAPATSAEPERRSLLSWCCSFVRSAYDFCHDFACRLFRDGARTTDMSPGERLRLRILVLAAKREKKQHRRRAAEGIFRLFPSLTSEREQLMRALDLDDNLEPSEGSLAADAVKHAAGIAVSRVRRYLVRPRMASVFIDAGALWLATCPLTTPFTASLGAALAIDCALRPRGPVASAAASQVVCTLAMQALPFVCVPVVTLVYAYLTTRHLSNSVGDRTMASGMCAAFLAGCMMLVNFGDFAAPLMMLVVMANVARSTDQAYGLFNMKRRLVAEHKMIVESARLYARDEDAATDVYETYSFSFAHLLSGRIAAFLSSPAAISQFFTDTSTCLMGSKIIGYAVRLLAYAIGACLPPYVPTVTAVALVLLVATEHLRTRRVYYDVVTGFFLSSACGWHALIILLTTVVFMPVSLASISIFESALYVLVNSSIPLALCSPLVAAVLWFLWNLFCTNKKAHHESSLLALAAIAMGCGPMVPACMGVCRVLGLLHTSDAVLDDLTYSGPMTEWQKYVREAHRTIIGWSSSNSTRSDSVPVTSDAESTDMSMSGGALNRMDRTLVINICAFASSCVVSMLLVSAPSAVVVAVICSCLCSVIPGFSGLSAGALAVKMVFGPDMFTFFLLSWHVARVVENTTTGESALSLGGAIGAFALLCPWKHAVVAAASVLVVANAYSRHVVGGRLGRVRADLTTMAATPLICAPCFTFYSLHVVYLAICAAAAVVVPDNVLSRTVASALMSEREVHAVRYLDYVDAATSCNRHKCGGASTEADEEDELETPKSDTAALLPAALVILSMSASSFGFAAMSTILNLVCLVVVVASVESRDLHGDLDLFMAAHDDFCRVAYGVLPSVGWYFSSLAVPYQTIIAITIAFAPLTPKQAVLAASLTMPLMTLPLAICCLAREPDCIDVSDVVIVCVKLVLPYPALCGLWDCIIAVASCACAARFLSTERLAALDVHVKSVVCMVLACLAQLLLGAAIGPAIDMGIVCAALAYLLSPLTSNCKRRARVGVTDCRCWTHFLTSSYVGEAEEFDVADEVECKMPRGIVIDEPSYSVRAYLNAISRGKVVEDDEEVGERLSVASAEEEPVDSRVTLSMPKPQRGLATDLPVERMEKNIFEAPTKKNDPTLASVTIGRKVLTASYTPEKNLLDRQANAIREHVFQAEVTVAGVEQECAEIYRNESVAAMMYTLGKTVGPYLMAHPEIGIAARSSKGTTTWLRRPSGSDKHAWGWDGTRLFRIADGSNKPFIVCDSTMLLLEKDLLDAHSATFANVRTPQYRPTLPRMKLVTGVPGCGKTHMLIQELIRLPKGAKPLMLTISRDSAVALRERVQKEVNSKSKRDNVRVATVGSFLLNRNTYAQTFSHVLIDEVLMTHPGEIFLALDEANVKTGAVMVGDACQIPYIVRCAVLKADGIMRYAKMVDLKDKKMSLLHPVRMMTESHRCPADVCARLSPIYQAHGGKMEPGAGVSRNASLKITRINSINDVVHSNNTTYITFTQSEKDALRLHFLKDNPAAKFRLHTVHEFQGDAEDHITIVRLDKIEANIVYSSVPHHIVAISRHRKQCEYLTVKPTDAFSTFMTPQNDSHEQAPVPVISEASGITSTGGAFAPLSYIADVDDVYDVSLFRDTDNNLRMPIGRPNAFIEVMDDQEVRDEVYDFEANLAENFAPTTTCIPMFTIQNSFVSADRPVEAEFPPDPQVLQDYIDAVAPGSDQADFEFDEDRYAYSTTNFTALPSKWIPNWTVYQPPEYGTLIPTLKTSMFYPVPNAQKALHRCVQKRNLNVLQQRFNTPAHALALDMWDAVVDMALDAETLKAVTRTAIRPSAEATTEWLKGQNASIFTRMDIDTMINDVKGWIFSLSSKKNAKPKIGWAAFGEPAYAQVIAAHSKLMNTKFCPKFVELTRRIMLACKPHVKLFTGMSNDDFNKTMNETLRMCLDEYVGNEPNKFTNLTRRVLEIDFEKFDKSQDELFLELDCIIMAAMGIPPKEVELWRQMHIFTKLVSQEHKLSYDIPYQRKSGDASTWILNTTANLAMFCYAFRGSKIDLLMVAGDDNLAFGDVKPVASDLFASGFNMSIKVFSGYLFPYFCSKFFIPTADGWVIAPDFPKFITKLGRHDIVNYEHVEELRQSALDHYEPMLTVEIAALMDRAVMDRYGRTYPHEVVFRAVRGLLHSPSAFRALFEPHPYLPMLLDPSRPRLDM